MIVKINDKSTFEKKLAFYGYDFYSDSFEVQAIRKRRKEFQYLICVNSGLFWWYADLLSILDDNVPVNWVKIEYKKSHKFKNKKYDFRISTEFYYGPKEFLENEDFLFDIYENPSIAYEFFYQYLKKNRSDINNKNRQ